MSESELSPIQRALRARQEQMRQSVLEMQRQVRRFRDNVAKIPSPSLAPQEEDDDASGRLKG